MRDEFSTSTAPHPRCGFIRINPQKLTANGPATAGRLRINANKVENYKNQLPFGQSMSAHVQNLDDATDYGMHVSL
jgi:hypothetical protein